MGGGSPPQGRATFKIAAKTKARYGFQDPDWTRRPDSVTFFGCSIVLAVPGPGFPTGFGLALAGKLA